MAGHAARKTVSQEEITEMYRLYTEEALSPMEIAPLVKRTPPTVVRYLREQGLPNVKLKERPPPETFTSREQREQIKRKLEQQAIRLLDQMGKPFKAWAFGGKDGQWVAQEMMPQPRDEADIMRAVGLAADYAMKLDAYDAQDATEVGKTFFGAIVGALGLAEQRIGDAKLSELAGDAIQLKAIEAGQEDGTAD